MRVLDRRKTLTPLDGTLGFQTSRIDSNRGRLEGKMDAPSGQRCYRYDLGTKT